MKSPTQRRVAIVALLLAPALTACGFNAQTDQVYQPATGTNDRSGTVDILNAVIVSPADGSGTFAGTFVNKDQTRSDRLESVTGSGITASRRSVEVPAGDAVPPSAEAGLITLKGEAIKPGYFIRLTFVFTSGQSTTMLVPVVARTGDYADIPLPSSSGSSSASATPSATPTESE